MNNPQENVVRMIIEKCTDGKVCAPSDLVSFLVNLSRFNPMLENKHDIVQFVTNLLSEEENFVAVTLKMQFLVVKCFQNRETVIRKHRLCLHQKTIPLIMDVCEIDCLKSTRDTEKLYQQILVIISLLSGLGDPTEPTVLRDVAIALKSIYKPSELIHFVQTLSKREKEKQLMELMCIVTGIRIFEKDCRRGGEGIDDLPNILQDAIQRIRDAILECLENTMKKVYKITAIVEDVLVSQNSQETNIERKNEMLVAFRQQEICVRKLLSEVETCENEVEALMRRLRNRLFKLHDTVRYRTAIPTEQVYPQFIDLTAIWMSFQDEVIVLSYINSFLNELLDLCNKNDSLYEKFEMGETTENLNILTDAERLEGSMGNLIVTSGHLPIIYPSDVKDFEKLDLELLGFCASSFLEGKGALIPANPNNGIVKWNGKFYAFSSAEGVEYFAKDPDKCVTNSLDFIRKHIQYIHFLQFYHEIISQDMSSARSGKGGRMHQSQGVQTELHVLPANVDQNYSSNVWDHRRRALKLATICNCKTQSTQTNKSHYRCNASIQVAPPKTVGIQTNSEISVNTKTPKTFIFGLRGRKDNQQHVLRYEIEKTDYGDKLLFSKTKGK